MNKIECRVARRADYPSLIRIWREAFGDSQEAMRFLDLFYGSCGAFVLTVNGVVAAMAYLVYGGEYRHGEDILPCPYLYAVAVDKELRGGGYGKAIVRFAMLEARALGYRVIATCPETDSLITYYEKLGFTRREKLDGRFRPSQYMKQNVSFMPTVLLFS